MKKILLILCIVFFTQNNLEAQNFQTVVVESNTVEELDKICQIAANQTMAFEATEVEKLINTLLKNGGVGQSAFAVKQCSNVDNAQAIEVDNKRYILYNKNFFRSLENKTANIWSSKFVIAHEVGHHLSGHSLDGKGSTHSKELEADLYAGMALAKLGATLDNTLSAFKDMSEMGTSTHPGKSARVEAATRGWNSVQIKVVVNVLNDKQNDVLAQEILFGEDGVKESYQIGSYDDALEMLEVARNKYYKGDTENTLYYKALILSAQGDPNEEDAFINYLSINNSDLKKSRIETIVKKFVELNNPRPSIFTNTQVLYHLAQEYFNAKKYSLSMQRANQYIQKFDATEKDLMSSLIGKAEIKLIKRKNKPKIDIDKYYSEAFNLYKNKEYTEAQKLFLKLKDENHPESLYFLGYIEYQGLVESVNYPKALDYFTQAASKGLPEAQYQAAEMYYQGEGTTKDFVEAAKWYTKAAGKNIVEAQYKIGIMYLTGTGIGKSGENAEKWLEKAALSEHKGALEQIIVMYYEGVESEVNYGKAKKYCLLADEKHNDELAQYHLGLMYLEGNGVAMDTKIAEKWFKKAANSGHVQADGELKKLYKKIIIESTTVADDDDNTDVLEYRRKAALNGDVSLQLQLGNAYYKGDGVARNYTEAYSWYSKAAENGNADAQAKLAWMYYKGYGTKKSKSSAIVWWQKAARQDVAEAKNYLTRLGKSW